MFPILLASIAYYFFLESLNFFFHLLIAIFAWLWACMSATAFIGDIVGIDKRGLGLFPVCLFYFSFCCYILL